MGNGIYLYSLHGDYLGCVNTHIILLRVATKSIHLPCAPSQWWGVGVCWFHIPLIQQYLCVPGWDSNLGTVTCTAMNRIGIWYPCNGPSHSMGSTSILFSVSASGDYCRAFRLWISQTSQPGQRSNPQCSPASSCLLGGCSLMWSWGAPFLCCLQVPQNPLGIYSDKGQLRDSFGSEYWREGDNINNSRQWWLQCSTPTASFTMCSVCPTFTMELSTQAIIGTDLAGDSNAFLIKPEGWP